jgi:hypothetical protein
MIGTTFMMLDQELCCKIFYCTTDKMSSLITGQTPRTSKLSDNIFKNEASSSIGQTILNNYCLSPTCKVVSFGNNIPSL